MKVLLSIKPEFVHRIFSGEKQFEYRKSIFKRDDVKTVVIYSTMPEGKIVGEFSVEKILKDNPDTIWHETAHKSGIAKEFFDSYFSGRENAYAIKIADVIKYSTPLLLDDLKEKITAPQSFRYLDPEFFSEVC